MKSLKFMSLCLLSAVLVTGCGEKSNPVCGEKSNPACGVKVHYDTPQVAEGTVVAIGWRNPTEGKFKKFADEVMAKAKMSKDREVRETLEFLDCAGLDMTKVRWGLLTTSKPEVEGDDLKRFPDAALVLSVPHDLAKLAAAIAAASEGDIKCEDVTLANQKVTKLVIDDRDVREMNIVPCLASLGGELLIAASNEKSMERELVLYLEGKGASSDFKDFTLVGEEVLRLAVPQVGKMARELASDKIDEIGELLATTLPDGDKIITSLGTVQLTVRAPGGNSLDVSLIADTGAAEHAGSLVSVINGALVPAKAQLKLAAREDEDAKLAVGVLENFSAKAAGKRITLTLQIPAALVDKSLDAMSKKVLKNL